MARQHTVTLTAELDSTLADCTPFYYGDAEDGMVYFGSIGSATSVTVYVAPEKDGTFIAHNTGSADVTMTPVANKAIQIPDSARGAAWMKLVPDSDIGSVTISIQ